jgi:6-phosphogluconolactonase
VAGGSTPRRAYELAAELEPDWSGAELWWGDERCVPHDDSRSNYRLVREALLERVAAQPRAHPVETDRPPEAAAEAYDSALAGVELELALLGLGPDGHTASLFPHAPALEEKARRAVAAEPGLEPWVPRVTMTVPLLCAAKLVVFLAVGDAKAEAAARAFEGPPSHAVPASLIRSRKGRTVFILDQAAADYLPNVA